ncbi:MULTISPECIES: PTS fructose transporter subunit IIABC [Caproicibacterium]|uniref:Fructose-specific PTS transporter subunit EIIC n=1 Tax=Caproicibacterium argilliputei TaxID=3030016 RepID=A0AA97DAW1_9FIRM|nr:fructose-specific PTS transporter subunit EIIC [Caproicibacterium argilliputei]WOC32847.1 fructose-specific PTS transporter subunit EIIC [Caproicibacterium argilliputei]
MKIDELLQSEGIALQEAASSKEEAIDKLIQLLDQEGCISDKAAFKAGILEREQKSSTAVGGGIAIPHAKVAAVKKAGIAAMTVPAGVEYGAADHKPSDLLFMIAAPASGSDLHLQALQRLAVLLMVPGFKEQLMQAKDKEAFRKLIAQKEAEKFPEQAAEKAAVAAQPSAAEKTAYQVLAVTACPTGIAHTFMAAENLIQKAKKMGVSLKAETDGADGVQHALTPEEIAACKGIIVAADKDVEMSRFDGKPVLLASVSAGINKGESLIQTVLDGKAPVYHHTGAKAAASVGEESTGHKIYKQLMNGVSHMLPFVTGGGILIALAFLIDSANGITGGPNFGTTTAAAKFLKTIGGFAFNMMLPILAGFIAMAIADRPGLAIGMVGGIIAMNGSTFADPAGGKISAGFLGALLAGFIAGYLVKFMKKLFSGLPKSLDGIKPVLLYPLLGIFMIGIVMAVVNPLMILINQGITAALTSLHGSAAALLGMVVSGMMAIDMGGPINKASYLFATAQLASPGADGMGFRIMASCMIGGMVPPLAIALCTSLFKNRFTPKERQSGIVNYVLGLSFITEGAIPYAASDPLHVLPSMAAGSAVSGALSMLFGCQLRAPHGGIFVLPTISNPFGYFVALAIGTVVGCLLLAVLKKPLPQEVWNAKPDEDSGDLF